ncbi:MAG: putative acrylyl-CoA reductase AcuI [Candidatus Erwinia impunctatus]|nr:putative acrylyl-CoA reductase AcuI [Culicoides impunctatus]
MRAILIEESTENQTITTCKAVSEQHISQSRVCVAIGWSALNYKDALSITGKSKISKNLPMIPGIDFAGVVTESLSTLYSAGQQVILTGWGVGEKQWGGLAEKACVDAEWLLPMPAGLSGRNAMVLGTSGLTAMLCVMALEEGGITPKSGKILVTGASGAVGSTAIALLHALGYSVTAATGRQTTHPSLLQNGADDIIDRHLLEGRSPPLEKQHWAGAIDTLGGEVLARVLAQTHYSGVVAACGLAASYALPATVMPFILRNVRLQGIDSVQVPVTRRQQAWERLVSLLPDEFYQRNAKEISLDEVIDTAHNLINNALQGRIIVKIR